MLNFFVLPEISWSQGQLNLLKRQLKSCNDKDCLQSIQQESESIFNRVGKHFNDDFSGISNQISVNHCHSLVCEIFYHMERLKVYYNFKDVFFMNKLKKLKDNRDRFDSKKLSIEDFERLNQRAEEQYKDDIQSSQHFIDDKVFRLMELCDNLSRNLESIQGSLEMNNRRLNNELTAKILELQNESIWRDFINSSKESKKIEGAIRLASNNAGDKLIPRLKSIFVGFSTSTGNAIFPTALLQRIVKKYPIQ
jgi:predicted Holliday junction resolvase-like endonuclease